MVDFDVSRAVVLTITGAGTAFGALAALVVLTRLMGRVLGPTASLEPGSADDEPPAGPEGASASLVAQDAAAPLTSGHDPTLVAAVAAAKVVAAEDEGYEPAAFEEEAVPAPAGARGGSGWKSFGRWQTMSSRLTVHPRRAARRGR